MTTRNTYTAEFKRQAIELAAREDVGPIRAARDLRIQRFSALPLATPGSKSRAGGFPRSGSFDPDATETGNPAASQRS